MGRRHPSRVFGGRIIAAEMKADSAKKEAADKLREAAAETQPGLELPDDRFRRAGATIAEAIAGGEQTGDNGA